MKRPSASAPCAAAKRGGTSSAARPPEGARAPSGGSAACAAAKRGGQGFTLVEVLIALVLLAMLMLVLTSALRAMGQVETRIEQRVEDADDYRLANAFLAEALARASARRYPSGNADNPAQAPYFQGGPNALAWIGVMPARYGLGGRHYMRLALEPGEGGARLVLRYAPWTGAPGFDAWGQAAGQVLAAPASALGLRYLDPGTGQWSPVWPPPGVPVSALPVDLLPSAVALQVDGPTPPWPPLIVALTPPYSTDPSATLGAFGGGTR